MWCRGVVFFFFFKQKTAYEIKECDWSSDVCSSDLNTHERHPVVSLPAPVGRTHRSEEHTSELQSHSFISYAVFCLKKKKNRNSFHTNLNRPHVSEYVITALQS